MMQETPDASPATAAAQSSFMLRLVPSAADLAATPKASLFALVASNLVPLAGVLLLGWDLGLVLLLYWGESAVIFVFSLVKMARAAGLGALALVPFFLFHAGMFMGVHLVFLLTLFVQGNPLRLLPQLAFPLAALALSHLVSFWVNVRGRGERYAKPTEAMGGFYGRVVVMHLTILFGGFLVLSLGSPVWAVALLVVLKVGVDAAAHVRERKVRAQALATGWTPVEPAVPQR